MLALLLLGAAAPAPRAPTPAACRDDSPWTAPAAPFRIYGPSWYVGTCGLAAVLITSPRGHVLIDGTLADNAPLILANVRRAGFDPHAIRFILFSHAHFDHVGGIAALQRATGATVLGRGADARALRDGHGGADDPQGASAARFPPVANVRRFADDAVVRLGALAIHAVPTPGHTPGSTSWAWQGCDHGRCLAMVYADSISPIAAPGWRFSAHPPALAQFRASLARLAAQPCDLLITPHPSASGLWTRYGPTATQPPASPGQCAALAASATRALDQRLAQETAGTAP